MCCTSSISLCRQPLCSSSRSAPSLLPLRGASVAARSVHAQRVSDGHTRCLPGAERRQDGCTDVWIRLACGWARTHGRRCRFWAALLAGAPRGRSRQSESACKAAESELAFARAALPGCEAHPCSPPTAVRSSKGSHCSPRASVRGERVRVSRIGDSQRQAQTPIRGALVAMSPWACQRCLRAYLQEQFSPPRTVPAPARANFRLYAGCTIEYTNLFSFNHEDS